MAQDRRGGVVRLVMWDVMWDDATLLTFRLRDSHEAEPDEKNVAHLSRILQTAQLSSRPPYVRASQGTLGILRLNVLALREGLADIPVMWDDATLLTFRLRDSHEAEPDE